MSSRKLWLAIGTCLTAITAALAGETTWAQSIQLIVATVLGYFTANTVAKFAPPKEK